MSTTTIINIINEVSLWWQWVVILSQSHHLSSGQSDLHSDSGQPHHSASCADSWQDHHIKIITWFLCLGEDLKKPAPEVSSLPASATLTPATDARSAVRVSSATNVTCHRNGVFSCSRSSSGMTTNFVNPSYPNHDSSTGDCSFALILQPNVCQVKEHLQSN